MSDIDPTPTTPVTIGDRLKWLENAVEVMRGTGSLGNLTEIHARLSTIEGAIDQSFPLITSRLGDLQTRLDAIQAGIGAVPYNSLEVASVRGLLNSILRVLSAQASGLAPILQAGDISSSGTTVVNGLRFATFAEPISGIVVQNDIRNVTTDNGNWAGWQAYIQTNAPTSVVNGSNDAVNTWINLAGTGNYNFAVNDEFQITVYLRFASVSTQTLNSQIITVTTGGYSHTRRGVVWPSGYITQNTQTSSNSVFTSTPTNIAVGNYFGWRVTLLTGANARVIMQTNPTSLQVASLTLNTPYTIPFTTSNVAIDNWTSNDISPGNEFTVRWQPPA